jgi:hypothetical protein
MFHLKYICPYSFVVISEVIMWGLTFSPLRLGENTSVYRNFHLFGPYLKTNTFYPRSSLCTSFLTSNVCHIAPLLIHSLLLQDISRIQTTIRTYKLFWLACDSYHSAYLPFGTVPVSPVAEYIQTHIHSSLTASFYHLGSWINRVNPGLKAPVAASSTLLTGEVHLSSPL